MMVKSIQLPLDFLCWSSTMSKVPQLVLEDCLCRFLVDVFGPKVLHSALQFKIISLKKKHYKLPSIFFFLVVLTSFYQIGSRGVNTQEGWDNGLSTHLHYSMFCLCFTWKDIPSICVAALLWLFPCFKHIYMKEN